MTVYNLTNQQARTFMLLKQGLIGKYIYNGKEGIMDFITSTSCLQYDPIDICGRNAELVLQSRISDFTKQMLYDLLYKERKLIDYFDKNLCILPVTDWPYLAPIREYFKDSRGQETVDIYREQVLAQVAKRGFASSKDLQFEGKIDWNWGPTSLNRMMLEALYFRGDLMVHHKQGTIRYYSPTLSLLPKELVDVPKPFIDELDYAVWRIKRRIGAVGLLWNKPSDAFLFMRAKAELRTKAFDLMLKQGDIIELKVDGLPHPLYCLSKDESLLNTLIANEADTTKRMEFLAPLDSFLWDRKLIKALFNFEYTWEIYTPQSKRKYGYYTLPVLYGDSLIGRIELVCDRKNSTLIVKNLWLEDKIKMTKSIQIALNKSLDRFAKFNNCLIIENRINVEDKV